MDTDLTLDQLELIERDVYMGNPAGNPEHDVLVLVNEVKRLRHHCDEIEAELANLDRGIYRQDCEECGIDVYSLTKIGAKWLCGHCCFEYGRVM